jgi:hypothetical protein
MNLLYFVETNVTFAQTSKIFLIILKMPYQLRRVKTGYKVCLVADPSRCFSKKPLTKTTAEKQRRAIEGGSKFDKFYDQLSELGISEKTYLSAARAAANREGYDGDEVYLAEDGNHKLVYNGKNGIRKFGKVGYGDYLIYSLSPKFDKKTADKHRLSYHQRFNKSKLYEKDSPYILSLKILW